MKRLSIMISLLLGFSLALTGCWNRGGEVGAVLDYGFPLAIGQKAVVFSHDLEIKFIEVLEDSRCPSGTTCVWAGRISVKIELKDSDGKYEMVLVQPGLSQEHSEDYYKEYKLLYKINPYPQAGTEVEKEDYRLLLTISKQQE